MLVGGPEGLGAFTPPSPRSGHPRRSSRVRLPGGCGDAGASSPAAGVDSPGTRTVRESYNNGNTPPHHHPPPVVPRKEPADLLWMMSHKRCAKKDGDGQTRMDTGMAGGYQQSGVLFVVFCRVYEPLSPPPSRLLGFSRSVMRLPVFRPPRCALRSL